MGHGYTRLIISPILSSPPFFQSYFSLLEEYLNTPLSLSFSKITHETQASLNLHSAVSFRLLFFPVFRLHLEGRVSVFFFERARDENTYQKRERDLFIVSKHDSSLRRATERGRRRGLMNESPDIHRGEGGGNKGGEPRPREDGGLP